jgi:hypothetical protein
MSSHTRVVPLQNIAGPSSCRKHTDLVWPIDAHMQGRFLPYSPYLSNPGQPIKIQGNVHGRGIHAQAVRAEHQIFTQLRRPTTPPIWTQFKLRSKPMKRKNQKDNIQYKKWQINMVCGDPPCREEWLAKQFHEQSTLSTAISSAYSKRVRLSTILRAWLLVDFRLLEL